MLQGLCGTFYWGGGGGGGGAFIGIDHLLALFLIVIIHSFFSLSSLFLIDLCMLNTNLKV